MYDAYDALELAKYIVTKCIKDGCPISNLQLQKTLYFIQRQFLKNKGCKGKKILDRVRIFSLKNGTKTELLPFCQFFFFGIKIDKKRGVAKCNFNETTNK